MLQGTEFSRVDTGACCQLRGLHPLHLWIVFSFWAEVGGIQKMMWKTKIYKENITNSIMNTLVVVPEICYWIPSWSRNYNLIWILESNEKKQRVRNSLVPKQSKFVFYFYLFLFWLDALILIYLNQSDKILMLPGFLPSHSIFFVCSFSFLV